MNRERKLNNYRVCDRIGSFRIVFLLCLMTLLCFSACSQSHLIQNKGPALVAPAIGVEQNEVRLVRYATYELQPQPGLQEGREGLVVLTNDFLVLMEGRPEDMMEDISIPLSHIEGVHIGRMSTHLQLKSGDERMVIWLFTDRSSPKINEVATKLLYTQLLESGVPPFESTVNYRLRTVRKPEGNLPSRRSPVRLPNQYRSSSGARSPQ